MPTKVEPLAEGVTSRSKHNWKRLLDLWLKSDLKLSCNDFAKLHHVPYATLRDKELTVNKKAVKPFQARFRKVFQSNASAKASDIRKTLSDVKTAKGKHYIKALEQGRLLLEHLMIQSAEGFDVMSDTPYAYTSAGEAARISIQAAGQLRELCMDLQGIPDSGDSFGWPVTKGFWPHPYQRDFIFDTPASVELEGEEMFLQAFIGGIGSGKTRSGAEKFGLLAWLNRGTQGAVFAPTYRMLEDSTKPMFFKVLVAKDIAFKYRASDNSIVLFGDTKILFRSMEKYEHIRGMELGYFWIDEPGQMKDGKPFAIIMGRVRDAKAPQPAGLLTSTPDGLNWLYDEVVVKKKENRCRLYVATTRQNVSLRKDYVARLEALYDERFAKQELQGIFLNVFSGAAYWNFDRPESINNKVVYEPRLPLVLCFDLNVDPMCWNILQVRRHRDGYDIEFIFDELHLRTASTEDACAEFADRYKGHRAGVQVYGDATCGHRHTSATRTDYQIIKKALEREFLGVEMQIGKINPTVTDSVAEVNARLKGLDGTRRMFVNDIKCPETVKDFERTAFQPGTRTLDKTDPERTHHTDNLRYYVHRVYPMRDVRVRMQ